MTISGRRRPIFELLFRHLLQRQLGGWVEDFPTGRDSVIDFRCRAVSAAAA
jgi:hypothetical protein